MKVLVYIEQRDGKIRVPSLEAICAARSLSSSVSALALDGSSASADVFSYGAQSLYAASRSGAYSPDFDSLALANAARAGSYDVVIISATPRGKEIAPAVAVHLGAGFIGDVLTLSCDGSGISAGRSLYGGKVLAKFTAKTMPVVITTRPKMFSLKLTPVSGSVSEIPPISAPAHRAELVEASSSSAGKVDLTEADIIVSGGRGMKAPENFAVIEALAKVLNGVVGASRAAVDSGWRSHSEQVGQTGKVVAPQVYFACGISGAIQHLAGMSSSRIVIAINKDPEAPIFKVADYGIVGDVMQVVPALTEEIRKAVR